MTPELTGIFKAWCFEFLSVYFDIFSHYYVTTNLINCVYILESSVSVTWKSPFCNRASRPWRSTSRWGCSCTRSTGRTWRARLGPARWGGTGPGSAVRTRHSGPSCLRPAGRRVPTFPHGLRCSDWGTPGLRGTTSWLREVCCQAKTGGRSRVTIPLSCGSPAPVRYPSWHLSQSTIQSRGGGDLSRASWWTA